MHKFNLLFFIMFLNIQLYFLENTTGFSWGVKVKAEVTQWLCDPLDPPPSVRGSLLGGRFLDSAREVSASYWSLSTAIFLNPTFSTDRMRQKQRQRPRENFYLDKALTRLVWRDLVSAPERTDILTDAFLFKHAWTLLNILIDRWIYHIIAARYIKIH